MQTLYLENLFHSPSCVPTKISFYVKFLEMIQHTMPMSPGVQAKHQNWERTSYLPQAFTECFLCLWLSLLSLSLSVFLCVSLACMLHLHFGKGDITCFFLYPIPHAFPGTTSYSFSPWGAILSPLPDHMTLLSVAWPWYGHKQGCSVQLLICLQLFATPWTAAPQASLSITNSWNLLNLMSIELVMPSNILILCHPLLLLPSIFSLSQNHGLFQRVSSLHQVAKILELQLQHQFFQLIFRTYFL